METPSSAAKEQLKTSTEGTPREGHGGRSGSVQGERHEPDVANKKSKARMEHTGSGCLSFSCDSRFCTCISMISPCVCNE